MKDSHTNLQQAILGNSKIRKSRKGKVIDILNQNGIHDLDDLNKTMIPRKDLTNNEIRQLSFIKNDCKKISELQQKEAAALFVSIGQYTASKHEQTRIFNILGRNNILSKRILYSTSDEKLRNIPGIGIKAMSVLIKIKLDYLLCRSIEACTYGNSTIPMRMSLY